SMVLAVRSSVRKLISRTSSDSRCANCFPSAVSTSIPFRKLPAHSLPCVSRVSAEVKLVLSSLESTVCPKAEKGSELVLELSSAPACARKIPALLNSQTSWPSNSKRQPAAPAGLFHPIALTCRRDASAPAENV